MPADLTVLGIDTTGLLGGVALARGGKLLAETRLDARAAAGERILPQIDRLLTDLGLAKDALERLGVALGPGSFTGLRVGIATAQGLGQGLGIPVVGLSSLAARSFQLGAQGQAVLTAMAHRRGDVFVGAGFWEGGTYTELLAEASRPLAEAATWVAEVLTTLRGRGQEGLLCTGDATELLMTTLAQTGPIDPALVAVPGQPGALPGVIALMTASADESQALTGAALDGLAPRYLRGSDARLPSAKPRVG